jgi:hypothetical protein
VAEDPALIPFVIAMIALDTMNKSRVAQSFAIETIENLMADSIITDRLDGNFNFKHIEFMSITGQSDQFRIDQVKDPKEITKYPLKNAFKNLCS